MITETITNSKATYTILYKVEEEDNKVYLILNSLEYHCLTCEAKDQVNLSLVPVHNIALICVACDTAFCTLPEEHFKIRLTPCTIAM